MKFACRQERGIGTSPRFVVFHRIVFKEDEGGSEPRVETTPSTPAYGRRLIE